MVDLATPDTDETEVLNAVFASVFTDDMSQASVLSAGGCGLTQVLLARI